MKIPIYNCEIDENDNLTGIYAMSFVECPANETEFVALEKAVHHRLHINRQKQILSGVVLKPGQLIYREDGEGNPYYIRFSAKQIEKIAAKMMRRGIALYNTTHHHEAPLHGNYLLELWTVADPRRDKSVAIGLGEQPAGTLCASYRITDPAYWREQVLTGNIKGFSIEGFFNQIKVNMNQTNKSEKLKKGGRFNGFLRTMGVALGDESATAASAAEGIVNEARKDATASGTALLVFELSDGQLLEVDNEGFATLDGVQAPAGIHELADGNIIVIDENGTFQATQSGAKAETPATPNAELSAAIRRGKAYLALGRKERLLTGRIEKLEAEVARLQSRPSTTPIRANNTRLAASNTSNDSNRMVAEILAGKIKK